MQNPLLGLPVVTKILSGLLITTFFLGLSNRFVHWFALIPGFTIPPHFYFWNIITASYLETSVFALFVSIFALVVCGKYLEPIWGSKEFLKFVIIVNACSGVATFFGMIAVYFFFANPEIWFSSKFCGFGAATAGFTVALKQLIPDQEINLMFGVSIRVRQLPSILFFGNLAFLVLGFPSQSFPFTMWGITFSWIYLRFYQVKANTVGDMNESFSFASFFPEPLQPSVGVCSNITFNILRILRICSPVEHSESGHVLGGNSFDSADTERRRARALRALDQRLQMQDFTNQASQADIINPTKDIP